MTTYPTIEAAAMAWDESYSVQRVIRLAEDVMGTVNLSPLDNWNDTIECVRALSEDEFARMRKIFFDDAAEKLGHGDIWRMLLRESEPEWLVRAAWIAKVVTP